MEIKKDHNMFEEHSRDETFAEEVIMEGEESAVQTKSLFIGDYVAIVSEMTDIAVVGDISPLIDPMQYGSANWICLICGNCSDLTRLRCWYCSSLRPEMRPAYTPNGVLYKRKDGDSSIFI